ncbi:nucleoside hydrolase [Anaeromicropila populeti]|uniref:Inosine-uridine preferring nucleoside hydrolase n=1 Tax=Anaeromicropila populeti TaxID=37658 RepID=A0A1I6KAV4_9FIRM|nr:nucleoside hydrolase [Anaeromicropila populeti]SFR88372.1 Inosine-uridine preferring nucleoside hydrolase [Anaeromicropila populeti]
MTLNYTVPEYKRLRVIIDTDAACEADDPFAIAHGVMSKKFDVKAIFAEQFGEPSTTKRSYDEIITILDAMSISIPVFMGEEGTLSQVADKEISPAASFLIEEAMREDEKPLYVLCIGAITNIASAIKKCPEIISKMTVVWIGGQNLDHCVSGHREFNAGNDIEAINLVVSSGVEFWQIPNNVYGSMHIGLAEIQKKIYPCGKIGKHLLDNMLSYNASECAGWTAGESWSLGDNPAIGVALEPNCGGYVYREAPIFNDDTTYRFEEGRPMIRVYTSINSRFVIEDFICKLQLLYETEDMEM